jgi:hypothetical protein
LRFPFSLTKAITSAVGVSEIDPIAFEGVEKIKKIKEIWEVLIEFLADQFARG